MISDYARVLLKIEIWREMRGVPAAWKAVAHVNLNRALHPSWWGTTLVQVITHKWQFSSMTATGDPNLTQWPQEDATWLEIGKAVDDVLDAGEPDPTDGAIDYFSAPITSPPTSWGQVEETLVVGSVHFFRQLPPASLPSTG